MSAFSAALDGNGLFIALSWLGLSIAGAVFLLVLGAGWLIRRRRVTALEISEVELGIGKQKIVMRPNHQDAQIAYQLWVEVSTRKIGLPIDLEHDVIAEVYNSWYEFFGVTRELIKNIPAAKVRGSESTQQLVCIAVEVLNEGLRPHLTTWQARFRRWYDRALNTSEAGEMAPQDLQKGFPKYEELVAELLTVNQRLMQYRATLRSIALDK